MSPGEELIKWLCREEKTFKESLDFAIKAWQSDELSLSLKYEIIINWFCNNLIKEYQRNSEEFDWQQIEQFLHLKCSPFLISAAVKSCLVEVFIKLAKIIEEEKVQKQSRQFVEVFLQVIQSNLSQGCFLNDHSFWCKTIAVFFTSYNSYIQSLEKFLPVYENEFFSEVLKHVKYFVQQVDQPDTLRKRFQNITMKSFLELIILLKSKKLNYFEDVLALEKILFFENNEFVVNESFFKMPAHVVIQHYEYAIVQFRGYSPFFQTLLGAIFDDDNKFGESSSPGLVLTVTAHFLYLFRKYDIQLNFEYATNQTALQFIGKAIAKYVELYSDEYMYEVVNLLCSALRLNPLILEQNIFNILTRLLVAPKTESSWNIYQEFVVILIEMFRKLSKGEKLVANLLKSIKEHLKTNKVSKKLKRKLKGDPSETPEKKMKIDDNDCSIVAAIGDIGKEYENNFYLQILANEFKDSKSQQLLDERQSFKKNWSTIYYAWPAHSAGVSFSKFISSLLSKPSLVIWKTLVYSFSECIESLESSPLGENLFFMIDFNAALLCQYLAGTRLAEQSNKFLEQINDNRTLTCNMLNKFGQTLLKFEHNNRTMNAFLQICYHLGCFDLIRSYYCPDSLLPEDIGIPSLSKNPHNYLNQDEWTLIEQRIVNFGKNDCKVNMNRLRLQRLKARILFGKKHEKQIDVQKFLLSSALSDVEQLRVIFGNTNNIWLIQHLSKEQQMQICDLFLMDPLCANVDFLSRFTEIHDFLELILINIYKYLGPCLPSKKSVLRSINFDELLSSSGDERIKFIVKTVKESTEPYTIKKYVPETIESLLKIIKAMPVGYCSLPTKTLIFTLNLALYKDLLATRDHNLSEICLGFFTDIMHFGEPIRTFDYFDIENFISIFPPTKCTEFYEHVFGSFSGTVDTEEKCITRLIEILKSKENELDDDYLKICEVVIASRSYHMSAKFKKYKDEILRIYVSHINRYFSQSQDTQDAKESKEFVNNTLSVYATYICSFLGKADNSETVDEQFRKVCKIYIGHSINCRNQHAIRLLSAVLLHRVHLHFDPDEIEFVLQQYWDQLMADIQTNTEDTKNMESVIQLVLNYKTEKDFVEMLSKLEKDVKSESSGCICKILLFMSKCQLTSVKGAILNDYFKRITFGIILQLKKNDDHQIENMELVLSLLECQRTLCENTKIPVSMDSIDNILMLLININIKKFKIIDTNAQLFYDLYKEMVMVCTALMKYRHLLVVDRIPQFMHVFKDLLQAVCWYKCDRQQDTSIDGDELDNLAEIAHQLENLMHLIAYHSLDVKKVAPYVLIFTISLMVTNKRSTTLYPKIKTHIENICYDLVACCDHRVGNFILRCCNDAMKQVYETLCKEFKKYHKFKGKV